MTYPNMAERGKFAASKRAQAAAFAQAQQDSRVEAAQAATEETLTLLATGRSSSKRHHFFDNESYQRLLDGG